MACMADSVWRKIRNQSRTTVMLPGCEEWFVFANLGLSKRESKQMAKGRGLARRKRKAHGRTR
jgi:hypothetical protein